MQKKVKVTLVTPTFNRVKYLKNLWNSIKNQTLKEFEWIVVDDGSNDKTREYIKSIKDHRIVYFWQENQGVNSARNRATNEIRSSYVIYIDSDDLFFSKDTLERMYEKISSCR